MIIRYWGVRGSLPVPGVRTVRYGGNTACVTVQNGDRLLVIDAGTGIVELGDRIDPAVREVFLLLSHRHLDHVQGLPFFAPLYSDFPKVTLLDFAVADGFWSPLALFDGVSVPIRAPQLNGGVTRAPGDPMHALRTSGWEIERMALQHPGGSNGFRVKENGRHFAHLTDTELQEGRAGESYFARCVEFCRGADVLSHDAQYLAAEMEQRRGRGHSAVERVCELALEAAVRKLILFHHDPARDDNALDEIGRVAAARVATAGIECLVAREGLVLEV